MTAHGLYIESKRLETPLPPLEYISIGQTGMLLGNNTLDQPYTNIRLSFKFKKQHELLTFLISIGDSGFKAQLKKDTVVALRDALTQIIEERGY